MTTTRRAAALPLLLLAAWIVPAAPAVGVVPAVPSSYASVATGSASASNSAKLTSVSHFGAVRPRPGMSIAEQDFFAGKPPAAPGQQGAGKGYGANSGQLENAKSCQGSGHFEIL